MSKFINPKADARQGAFLAVKVNSLNSSRVLCSLSSLSLLMAQSSPHLSQRMSQVRYCPGSDTTVPTGNANRFEISFSPDLSHRLIDLDIWFLSHSLLGTTTFHLARKDSLPISLLHLTSVSQAVYSYLRIYPPKMPMSHTASGFPHISYSSIVGQQEILDGLPCSNNGQTQGRSLSQGLFHSSSLSLGSPAD